MGIYEQMTQTALNAGINIINKNRAAQILAVVYLYGDESAVYSEKMRVDISYICKKYGIYGGGFPDSDIAHRVKGYVKEVRKGQEKPMWLTDLEKDYNISFPQYKEYTLPKPPERRC